MRAIVLAEPGAAGIGEAPAVTPGPDDVVIRVAYVGFCGSDLTSFRGLNPLVSYPRVPGHEIAGTVEELGSNVGDLQVGEDVTVMPYFNCGICRACRSGQPNACAKNQTMGVQREGAMTERIVVPRSKVLSAAGLALRDLALIEPCAVGFHAVARAKVAAGETVVVLGCGMIGLGAIIGAVRMGARVVAVDLAAEKLAVARSLGAAETINAGEQDVPAALAAIEPEGAHVVIEAVGTQATFLQAIDLAGTGGRVTYIGYAKAPIAYDTKQFILKELDIRGSRNALRGDFENVIDYFRSHPGTADRLISRVVPLEEGPAALEAWDRDPGAFIKIVVDMRTPQPA